MIDGAVGLIVLAAVLRGAIKGVGDTVIKMICIIGGIGLGVYFKDKLKAFLMQTKLERTMHMRIFELIRGDEAADPSSGGIGSFFGPITSPDGTGEGVISKSLGGIFSDAADRAADAAAERLTEIAIGVIAFALRVNAGQRFHCAAKPRGVFGKCKSCVVVAEGYDRIGNGRLVLQNRKQPVVFSVCAVVCKIAADDAGVKRLRGIRSVFKNERREGLRIGGVANVGVGHRNKRHPDIVGIPEGHRMVR